MRTRIAPLLCLAMLLPLVAAFDEAPIPTAATGFLVEDFPDDRSWGNGRAEPNTGTVHRFDLETGAIIDSIPFTGIGTTLPACESDEDGTGVWLSEGTSRFDLGREQPGVAWHYSYTTDSVDVTPYPTPATAAEDIAYDPDTDLLFVGPRSGLRYYEGGAITSIVSSTGASSTYVDSGFYDGWDRDTYDGHHDYSGSALLRLSDGSILTAWQTDKEIRRLSQNPDGSLSDTYDRFEINDKMTAVVIDFAQVSDDLAVALLFAGYDETWLLPLPLTTGNLDRGTPFLVTDSEIPVGIAAGGDGSVFVRTVEGLHRAIVAGPADVTVDGTMAVPDASFPESPRTQPDRYAVDQIGVSGDTVFVISGTALRRYATDDLAYLGETTVDGSGAALMHPTLVCVPPHVNEPPFVDPGGPYTGNEGAAIPLGGFVFDPDDPEVAVSWEVSPAACVVEPAGDPMGDLICPGDVETATLSLSADDGVNEVVTQTTTADFGNLPPVIEDVSAPGSGEVGSEVAVTVVATDPGADELSVSVDWGDGSSTVVDPFPGPSGPVSHTYSAAGTWNVLVEVTDADGAAVSRTATIDIAEPAPQGPGGVADDLRSALATADVDAKTAKRLDKALDRLAKAQQALDEGAPDEAIKEAGKAVKDLVKLLDKGEVEGAAAGAVGAAVGDLVAYAGSLAADLVAGADPAEKDGVKAAEALAEGDAHAAAEPPDHGQAMKSYEKAAKHAAKAPLAP